MTKINNSTCKYLITDTNGSKFPCNSVNKVMKHFIINGIDDYKIYCRKLNSTVNIDEFYYLFGSEIGPGYFRLISKYDMEPKLGYKYKLSNGKYAYDVDIGV